MSNQATKPRVAASGSRRSFLGSVAAATTAGIAGCVGSGGGNRDGGTIVVGATIPETGRLSGLGSELREGYELGVKHVNEDGGIGGRELELKLRDDESDPKKVGQGLQKLLSSEDLAMIWGSITTPMVLGGSAVAEQRGLPFLGVGFAYMRPHRQKDLGWTYVPYPKTRDIVRANVELLDGIAADRRPERIGIWEPNSGWGKEMADAWEDRLSSAGYRVVVREKFGFGTKDFSSLVSKSKDAGVQALFSNPIPPDGITAMKQMKTGEFAPQLVEFVRAAHSNGWWKALGPAGAYTVTSPGWVPGLTGNGNERFVAGYDAEYGSGDMTIPVTAGGAYNLVQTARQALEAAESTDPSAIRSALRNETFETVIGSFGFEPDGTLQGDLKTPTGQWWNGKQRLIYPETDSDLGMDLRYPMEPWGER